MKAFVDPVWDFYWKSALLALPMWEGGGQDTTRNYGKNQMEVEFGSAGQWKPHWDGNLIRFNKGDALAIQSVRMHPTTPVATHTLVWRGAIDLLSNNGFFILRRQSSNDYWSIHSYDGIYSCNIKLAAFPGGGVFNAQTAGWNDGKIHTHVVVSNGAGGAKWYFDGELAASTATTIPAISIGTNFWKIGTDGAGPTGNFNLTGTMGMLSVHDRAFSEEEVQMITADPYGPYTYAGTTPALQPSFPQVSVEATSEHRSQRPTPWNITAANVPPEWQWFWKDAVSVYMFGDSGKYQSVNLAGPGEAVLTNSVTEPNVVPSKYGPGILFGTSSDVGRYVPTAEDPASSDDFNPAGLSLVFFGAWRADDANDRRIITRVDPASSSTNSHDFALIGNSAGNIFRMRLAGSGSTINYDSTVSPEFGKVGVFAGTWDGSNVHLYAGGQFYENVGTKSNSLSLTTSRQYALLNNVQDSTRGWTGEVYYTAVFSRGLTFTQLEQLNADPFGPFRHYRDTQPGSYQYFNTPGSLVENVRKVPARPPQWNVDPAFTASEWEWFWEHAYLVDPIFEVDVPVLGKYKGKGVPAGTWTLPQEGPVGKYFAGSVGGIDYGFNSQDVTGVTGYPFTIFSYAKWGGVGEDRIFDWAYSGSTATNYTLQFDSATGQARMRARNNAAYVALSAGPNLDDGKFHLIAAVHRSDTLRELWVDGMLVGESTPVVAFTDQPDRAAIGRQVDNTPSGYFDPNVAIAGILDFGPDPQQMLSWAEDPFGPLRYHRNIYRAQTLLAIIGYAKLGGNPYVLLNALKGAEGSAEAQGVIDTLASGAKEGIGIVESLESSVTSDVGAKGALSQALAKASEIATQTGSKGAEGNTVTTESSVATEVGFKDGTGQVFTSSEELMTSTSTKAGIGEAQLHELAYLITEARKEGYGEALAYDDGVLVVAAAKSADGNAFGKSNNLILSSTLKGGLGLSTATATGYGVSDGTKAGTGRAQNNAFGALFALSSKATSGNTLLRQSSYFNLLGEKAGLGRTFGHAFGWATEEGIKSITTLGFALLSGHAYAGTSGEKEALGQGDTVPHAYLEAVGEKEALGRTTAVAHAYLEALGEKEVSGTALGYEFGYETAEGEKNITVLGYVFGQGFGYGVTSGEKEALGYADLISQGQLESLGLKATEASAILSEFAVTEYQGSKSSFGEALAKDSESAVIIGLKSIGSDVTVTGHGSVSSNLIKEMSSSTFVNAFGAGSESGQKEGSGAATTLGTPVLVALGIKDGVGVTQIVASGTIEGLGLKGMSADLIVVGHGWLNSLQTVSLDREIIDILIYINTGVSLDAQVVLNRDMSMYVNRQLDSDIYIVRTKNIDVEA